MITYDVFRTYLKLSASGRELIQDQHVMNMVDMVDELIISALSKNSNQDIFEIWDFIRECGHNVTEEEIESRKHVLEEKGIIKRYTIVVDSKKIPDRVIRVDLLTFRTSQALPKRVEDLKKYLNEAPFVVFSGKTRGGHDWITIKAFLSSEMADEENDIYRNLFGDIIQAYEVYDFIPQTTVSLNALTYTISEYKEFLKEWIPPFVGN